MLFMYRQNKDFIFMKEKKNWTIKLYSCMEWLTHEVDFVFTYIFIISMSRSNIEIMGIE